MKHCQSGKETYFDAIRRTPSAMVTVVTATRPSGMTETAKLNVASASGRFDKQIYVFILPQPHIQHVFYILLPSQSNSYHQQA